MRSDQRRRWPAGRTWAIAALAGVVIVGCHGRSQREAPIEGTRRVAEIRARGNHLTTATSAYLREHDHNPVDWYAWGPEALALAQRLDRPIFLSIGYVSCHWCHVMEKEVF